MSELDLTAAESKATYEEIKQYVLDKYGLKVSSLNIAQIKTRFVKFRGKDKAAISERSDYGYRCMITSYDKIKNRLQSGNICISDTTVRLRKDTVSMSEKIIEPCIADRKSCMI